MIHVSQTDAERERWRAELADAQASLDSARANAPRRRERRDHALAHVWMDGEDETTLAASCGLGTVALRELISDLLIADVRDDDAYHEAYSEARRVA
jgi:hypothetical protein